MLKLQQSLKGNLICLNVSEAIFAISKTCLRTWSNLQSEYVHLLLPRSAWSQCNLSCCRRLNNSFLKQKRNIVSIRMSKAVYLMS